MTFWKSKSLSGGMAFWTGRSLSSICCLTIGMAHWKGESLSSCMALWGKLPITTGCHGMTLQESKSLSGGMALWQGKSPSSVGPAITTGHCIKTLQENKSLLGGMAPWQGKSSSSVGLTTYIGCLTRLNSNKNFVAGGNFNEGDPPLTIFVLGCPLSQRAGKRDDNRSSPPNL